MLKIQSIDSKDFLRYGYKLDGDFKDVEEYLEYKSIMPKENNIYVRDDELMHNLPSYNLVNEDIYGFGEMQIGYCNGFNSKLNCLEYHTCPEVDIPSTDLILLLAHIDDIKDGVINSEDVKAFYVKKGEAVVLNPYVLHYSPCKTNKDGFRCAIILGNGTNRDLNEIPKDKRLWKENKWLYAHKDTNEAKCGAYIGIIGENIEIEC